MEEEKKILLPEEPNSPNSGRRESLPNMDVDYNENIEQITVAFMHRG